MAEAEAKRQFHIAIVGAGLGGLAAAISIAQGGHRATILEQATELGEVGAGIQVPPNSSKILQAWGILDKIEAFSVRPHDFVLRSYKDGRVLSTQNTFPYTMNTYSAPYLHIHRADYHRVLVEEARRLGVDIKLKSHVVGVDFTKPAVQFGDGMELEADLVIGADGLKSVTREALLGRKDPPRLTGDLAYRIIVKVSDMRKHPNLLPLIETPAINYWMGPNSHVVGYRMKGGDLYNIVLCCPDTLPELVNTQKADLEEMRGIFAAWDPRLRELLGLVTETSKWRLQNSEEMDIWSAKEGTFALLGDACHATLPYLASGAAMALEDGQCLGLLLSRISPSSIVAASRLALHDILTLYETIRKSRTTRIVKQSSHYRHIFHMHDGPRQQERDRQLTEYNRNPFEGYPNKWKDPVFQKWLWGYDVKDEVDSAWKRYENGVFPGTGGGWASSRL